MAGILDTVDQRTQLVGENRLEILMFRLFGRQLFAINVFKVQEVLQLPKLTLMPQRHPFVCGVVNLRGQTLPVIDPASGAEKIRAAIGQRYYMVDQRVSLNQNSPVRTGKQADLLAAFSATFAPKTTLDTAWQYNPRDNWTERFNFGFRFQPGYARTVGVSWRYRRNYSTDPANPNGFRDIDLTGQWPLWGNWYGVGRYNRNLRDHRLTQGIAGLEYNGGCWVFRGVVQHLTTSATDSTRALFFQLEFNGAGSIGSSPLNVLKRSVPGYAKINDGSTPFVGDNDDF